MANPHPKKKTFIPQPEYPGGPKAMGAFIASNLVYPKEAIENKISGIVKVRIEIDYHGLVIHAKAMNHIGYGCDEEAMRVSSLLKFEVSKLRHGKIRYYKNINIRFTLKTNVVQNQTYHYQLVPSTAETEIKPNANYQYKITLTTSTKTKK